MRLLSKFRYPAIRKGRNRYIQDSLNDATPLWVEILICLILSPVLFTLAVYGCLRWLLTFRYPLTSEGARLRITEQYLEDCQKLQEYEAKKKTN